MTNIYPTFTVIDEVAQDGLLKISIEAQDVPTNLLGVSFHLAVSADSVEWTLDHSEVGDVFAVPPMFLARESVVGGDGEKSIVVGMSLRRGETLEARDGVLGVFYLRPADGEWKYAEGSVDIDFTNMVASVYDNGRIDIENVAWIGSGELSSSVANSVSSLESGSAVALDDADVVLGNDTANVDIQKESMTTGSSSMVDSRATTLSRDNSLLDVYVFLVLSALLLLIVIGGWLVVKYRYEIKTIFAKIGLY